jgi:hypothetical protein
VGRGQGCDQGCGSKYRPPTLCTVLHTQKIIASSAGASLLAITQGTLKALSLNTSRMRHSRFAGTKACKRNCGLNNKGWYASRSGTFFDVESGQVPRAKATFRTWDGGGLTRSLVRGADGESGGNSYHPQSHLSR